MEKSASELSDTISALTLIDAISIEPSLYIQFTTIGSDAGSNIFRNLTLDNSNSLVPRNFVGLQSLDCLRKDAVVFTFSLANNFEVEMSKETSGPQEVNKKENADNVIEIITILFAKKLIIRNPYSLKPAYPTLL